MRTLLLTGTSLLALSASIAVASAAPITFNYSGAIVDYTVTTTGLCNITAAGTQGGPEENGIPGDSGVTLGGDFNLTAGEMLAIAVGGEGSSGSGLGTTPGGGGGGGSFVVAPGGTPLLIASGGGGAGETSSGSSGVSGGGFGGGFGGGPAGCPPIVVGAAATAAAAAWARTASAAGPSTAASIRWCLAPTRATAL